MFEVYIMYAYEPDWTMEEFPTLAEAQEFARALVAGNAEGRAHYKGADVGIKREYSF